VARGGDADGQFGSEHLRLLGNVVVSAVALRAYRRDEEKIAG
jgi:hypothetical protein